MRARSTKATKRPIPALVLGAAMLGLGAGAIAQEAVSRPPLPTVDNPLDRATGLGLRGTRGAAPAAQVRPDARLTRRAGLRRTRSPTMLPVRRLAQLPTLSANVASEVQAPVLGLPDPNTPEPLRRRRIPERDAYASLGYRFGNIQLFPAVQQDIGYDSNPNRTSLGRKSSIVSRSEAELRVQSDWSRHELTGQLRGVYHDYPNVKEANRPDGAGRLNLRLDALRDTQIDLETRYLVDTQRPGSPDLDASVRDRPLVLAGGASAGVTQRFNRLSLGLRGGFDKVTYEDARLTSGAILDQSDRDRTQYELRMRAGYELKPGFTSFVEPILDTRVYDRAVDNAGFRRSSDGIGVRAGSTFQLTSLVTGEASAGYQVRKYEDERLKDLRGPLADAALIWSPTPLTTVRLRGSTQLAETTVENSSGAVLSQTTLEVQHDLRRNVSIIGAITLSQTDYEGVPIREDGFAGSVKLDYRLTRSVAVRASFTHERLDSTEPGSDYTANVYLVGLRFQP